MSFHEVLRVALTAAFQRQAQAQPGAPRLKQSSLDDIEEAHEGKTPGQWVSLPEASHALLLEQLEYPSPAHFPPDVAFCLKPHRRALQQTMDELPREALAAEN